MLSLGLTGGIAAGKSLLTNRFRELGAVVIDADQLARDVVAPGTPGLAAVVNKFGPAILLPDGTLDRPALGARVFADKGELAALNSIVHPLVREAASTLKRNAAPDSIVVQDIPLLVETGQGANFHLVLVVQAPQAARIDRMVRDRGMSQEDAMARIAAQASDEERAAAADVIITNDGSPEQAAAALDALWHGRLLPFAANLAAGASSDRRGAGPVSAAAAGRIIARVRHAAGELATAIEHLSTADGTAGNASAGGVLRLRLHPCSGAGRVELVAALARAGFVPGTDTTGPDATGLDPVLASADPGLPADLVLVGAARA
ncbi:dephospho-CoA kinase [Arthrobacter sp. LAPM80]|uniref:dephospho-CoA kinase n=1 Tax=Arthrobacter sp. LAPM80 TaxID=3141788 RepID=UPI00398BA5FC